MLKALYLQKYHKMGKIAIPNIGNRIRGGLLMTEEILLRILYWTSAIGIPILMLIKAYHFFRIQIPKERKTEELKKQLHQELEATMGGLLDDDTPHRPANGGHWRDGRYVLNTRRQTEAEIL